MRFEEVDAAGAGGGAEEEGWGTVEPTDTTDTLDERESALGTAAGKEELEEDKERASGPASETRAELLISANTGRSSSLTSSSSSSVACLRGVLSLLFLLRSSSRASQTMTAVVVAIEGVRRRVEVGEEG
jgi:hypothetical protein